MQGDLPTYVRQQLRQRLQDVERRAREKGLELVLEFELTMIRIETENALAANSARQADAALVMMERLKERIHELPEKEQPEPRRIILSRPRT